MADFYDPRFQGLLTLAAGLLSQSGWQPNRVGLGEAFGKAGGEALQSVRQAQLFNQQAATAKVMNALHQANANEAQFKLDQQQALPGQLAGWNQTYNGVMGNDAPMGQQTPMGPVGPLPSSAPPTAPSFPYQSPPSETVAPTVGVSGKQSQALYDLADQLDAKLAAIPNLHPEVEKRAQAQIAGIRARADRMLKLEESKKPIVEHNYPVAAVNGIAMVQPHMSLDQGKTWMPIPGSVPSPKFSSTPTANVTVNTGESFWKEFGKGQAQFMNNQQDVAQAAANTITTIHNMRNSLDRGAITGLGADAKLTIGRALSAAGFSAAQDPVANTQAYAAEAGNLVGQVIKQFGSGTGLSDADRQYALKISAGDINLDEKAMRRLLDIHEKANRVLIQRFNKRAAQVRQKAGDNLPVDFGVEEPPAYIPPKKNSGWSVVR